MSRLKTMSRPEGAWRARTTGERSHAEPKRAGASAGCIAVFLAGSSPLPETLQHHHGDDAGRPSLVLREVGAGGDPLREEPVAFSTLGHPRPCRERLATHLHRDERVREEVVVPRRMGGRAAFFEATMT